MKLFKIFFSSVIVLSFHVSAFSQDDDGEIKMSQPEWHLKRDQYAVSAIKLLRRLEILDSLIDSLKKVNAESESITFGCEDELYRLVGATKEQVADYRRKFDEAENKINSKTGTPSEIMNSFYGEVSESKIRCLPEFQDRYASLEMKVKNYTVFYPQKEKEVSSGTYIVARGDCLWKIAEQKYGSRNFWPVIWEANRNEISKEFSGDESYPDKPDPNFIYPGQVLKIPDLTDEQREKLIRNRRYKR